MNLCKVSFTAMLNTISAYWHMAGVVLIVLVLLRRPRRPPVARLRLRRDGERRPASATRTTNFSSPVFWYVFVTGLLMAQYTITGFDASAHMAEETHKASRTAAVGMYMSVVVSVIFGFILLVAVTVALPEHERCDRRTSASRPAGSGRAMSQNWAEACSSSASWRSSSA